MSSDTVYTGAYRHRVVDNRGGDDDWVTESKHEALAGAEMWTVDHPELAPFTVQRRTIRTVVSEWEDFDA
jgi:hypothetical protein